jgi:hypothetical protein
MSIIGKYLILFTKHMPEKDGSIIGDLSKKSLLASTQISNYQRICRFSPSREPFSSILAKNITMQGV